MRPPTVPCSGKSLRSGKPSKSSVVSSRRRSGWPVEDDAEHLPGLALVEAGRRPQAGDGRQRLPLGQGGLHPQPVAVGVRDQVGDHRERRRGALGQVVAEQAVELVEGQLRGRPGRR